MRAALFAAVGLFGLYGCYDYTLPSESESGKGGDQPKAGSHDDSATSDPLNPKNTAPTEGDAPISTNSSATSTTSSDAGTDSSAPPVTTNGCAPNGNFCGGPYTLLKCNADNTKTFLGKCANGCVNGACNPATKCVSGGTYCGGDKVNGDPDVLYKCGADGFATTVQQQCANGCMVAPAGQDDYCK